MKHDIEQTSRFALLRHARTDWNSEKRMQGQYDMALTVEGAAQARTWGVCLSNQTWDRIITSDLGRARSTASRINDVLGVPIIIDTRFREQDWGRWTGMTLAQIKETEPDLLAYGENGWNFQPPEGELRLHVLERSMQALKDAHYQWPGETILVITHEGVIKCLITHLRKLIVHQYSHFPLLSDHLHWLMYTPQGLMIEKENAIAPP